MGDKLEKKIENKEINNIDVEIETIATTPEDGFLSQSKIRPVNINNYGKFHKGYTTTKTYMTDDPRITRLFITCVCCLFLGIGLFMLLFKIWFFGIIFIFVSIFGYIKATKDIDKIAKELKKQGKDVTINSKEEAIQIKNDFIKELKAGFKESSANTFTKERFKYFFKITIPIYIIIVIIVTLSISVLINIFMGIFIFILLVIIGLLYYLILRKFCKY